MNTIIDQALSIYKPVQILLLFSGGHDSLCSTHYCANYLTAKGLDFSVYHGNTSIGIGQTREFVRDVCRQYSWKLTERTPEPGNRYEDLVRKYGFPGPASHKYMYRMLKERPLRNFVTHVCKSSTYARENVLLLTGIRGSESKIRMGYREQITKEGSRIWCSPIFFWSAEDIEQYIISHGLPRNSVKDAICISGECLCGAFAGKEEWYEINLHFPEAADEIRRLHKIAIANGHPWEWASYPVPYQRSIKSAPAKLYLCVGCEARNHADSDPLKNERKVRKRQRRRARIEEDRQRRKK
ncbi:phosphoadenosine phosphosulfate reductase domain-containing protein [Dinghuibacter silviterrae]|uniref:Phosphoadenosine phosphosulfate reductase family protein n=1 Tax=Dinghuibacter silviterrae TaxID=1539049 RepID=A0A4R8DHX3_9BACT|nr:phosphoadenosine phosphosulfate reductase family protein [Dinghuibacter silviterrae]TDW97068.1 phosphoadenosine phosphosulfate reductase family protein [Dinghuibacter silviterrae]